MGTREYRRAAKIGDTFNTKMNGTLEIIGYSDRKSYYKVRFIETGYVTEVRLCKIKRGKVKDKLKPRVYGVGFIGDGKYSVTTHYTLYQRWKHMLERCYSGNYPNYADCIVCERWMNFQNFVEDCLSLPGYSNDLSGLHLDKDTLVKGNRTYSPFTCQFITRAENFNYALGRY
ncbi:hypothetical protein OGA32_000117 [Salmonella enterica]|nr:hypothetical protein [Salmonella enterica]